ncbi:hypothetical protein HD806DRAFT_518089 [Xylariaceae sp. AK1471]|nr:hypothetical protein HD806DRAFT_518089 [Xylariaceae sp. AK1471]
MHETCPHFWQKDNVSHSPLICAETSLPPEPKGSNCPKDLRDRVSRGENALKSPSVSSVGYFNISPLSIASLETHDPSSSQPRIAPNPEQILTVRALSNHDTVTIDPRPDPTTLYPDYRRSEKVYRNPNVFQYMVEWWLWEICGLCVSISSIIAVFVLATNLDGSLLSDWESAISPSTVISALITLAKTSMLLGLAEGLSQAKWLYFWKRQSPLSQISIYEDASRGPWGSLNFLRLGLRRNPSFVACVGALITVLVLAMGPSAQQIVVFDTKTVRQAGDNSSIMVAKSYTLRNHSLTPSPPSRALIDGLLSERVNLKFTCQSGNCSWPDFTALGLCSSCADVAALTQVTSQYVPQDGFHVNNNFTLITPSGFQFEYNPGPVTDDLFSLSNGNETRFVHMLTLASDVEAQIMLPAEQGSNATLLSLAVVQQGELSTASELIKDPVNISNVKTTAVEANATVTECTINWCARTYQNFTVVQDELREYSVHKHPLDILLDKRMTGGLTHYHIPTPEDTWRHGVAPIYPFNDSTFTVEQEMVVREMIHAISTFFPTSGIVNTISGLAFQYGNNVSDRIDIITDSLTNWVQSRNDAIGVPGPIWIQATVIHIHWVWLTLPSVLVILSAVFLIIIMVSSHKSGLPTWKSSLMPLLFHGVNSWSDNEIKNIRHGFLEDKQAMQKAAKTMEVKLVRGDLGGTMFVRHEA